MELLLANAAFRLRSLGPLGWLDLLLVTVVCYLLLLLLRRSRVALLLRGVLVLVVLALAVIFLLPLPTFDWLVGITLLVLLITTPIVLQPELRRLLERVGRGIGLTGAVRQTAAEAIMPELMRAVDNLAASCTGALIALEGGQSLQEVAKSGVAIDSRLSSELLQTIFHDKTPLHDGAVVVSGDRVVAASAVLPLSEGQLYSYRRLGTRHRAAVGLSETSDALVVVVSEETGDISVARRGRLDQRLDNASLRQQIYEFYTVAPARAAGGSLAISWRALAGRLRPARRLTIGQLATQAGLILLAALLALALWSFVLGQTNPTGLTQIDNIPLRVEGLSPGLTLAGSPPNVVSAVVRTTAEVAGNLTADSFQASLALADLGPGFYQIPVEVVTGASLVEIVSAAPAVADVTLVPIVSQTKPVIVDMVGGESLSNAYQIVGQPIVAPAEVVVTGPEPEVEAVVRVEAVVSVADATTTIRETRPLRALDDSGRELPDVSLEPDRAQVTVIVARRQDARDVGVRAITDGEPPSGYWLSSLSASPAAVTLQGDPSLLAELNGFVDTLPVDISAAVGDLNVETPLDLPPGVTALDGDGAPLQSVTVTAEISPRIGDLLVTREIVLVGASPQITATLDPPTVDVLLSGPLPQLNEIEANPGRVQVEVDVSQTEQLPGQSVALQPRVLAPPELTAQLIPETVLVTFSR